MANWNALRWSEQIRTGAPSARHALTMLCLKCDDDGVLYRDAEAVAGLCEMAPRTFKTWRDYLNEHKFITVVRRIRRDGKEGKPLTLVNYPDAPHLNGQPIRLDYNGWHMFPKEPAALEAAGLSWIAGDTVNGIHPSANPARGPHASSARGMTSNDADTTQTMPRANPARGPRAKSAPHVGGKSCTPNAVPTQTHTQPPSARVGDESTPDPEARQSDDGWLAGSNEKSNDELDQEQPDTAGAALLRSLRAGDGTGLTAEAVAEYATIVDDYLADGNTSQVITQHLTTGLKGAGGIRHKLAKLADGRETLPATPPQSIRPKPVSTPHGCGDCLGGWITGTDGRERKCPTCLPTTASVA